MNDLATSFIPKSIKPIADLIGQESALRLVGALPRYKAGMCGKKSYRAWLYVPKKKHSQFLVDILGQEKTKKLVQRFSGEMLLFANGGYIHKKFKHQEIERFKSEGLAAGEAIAIVSGNYQHYCDLTRREFKNERK